MASLVKAGTITAPNASGNVADTSAGFPPDLLLATTTLDTTTTGAATARFTFGAAKSASSRASVSTYSRFGTTKSETSHVIDTSYFLSANAGSEIGRAHV